MEEEINSEENLENFLNDLPPLSLSTFAIIMEQEVGETMKEKEKNNLNNINNNNTPLQRTKITGRKRRKKIQNTNTPFPCTSSSTCEKIYSSLSGLQKHLRVKHSLTTIVNKTNNEQLITHENIPIKEIVNNNTQHNANLNEQLTEDLFHTFVKKELFKESANLFSKNTVSIPEEIDKIFKTEFSESSFGNINNALESENQKLKENLAIELSHRKELEEKIDRLSSEKQKIEQQQRNFLEISEQKSNTFIATINSLKQYCKQQNNNIQSDQEQYKNIISKILKETNSKIVALNAELEKFDQLKDSLITDKEKLTSKITELEDEITKLKNIIAKQEEESITLKSSLKQLLKL